VIKNKFAYNKKIVLICTHKASTMNDTLSFNNNTASGHKISRQGRLTLTYLEFLFVRGLNYLQGVLHSSSLPDYIEDKKSGGRQTDCLAKSLCAGSTTIIGREARNRQMLKTVNKSTLIGTL